MERVEYRVVGDPDNGAPAHQVRGPFSSKTGARRALDAFNPVRDFCVWSNVRIQSRTVTETPWTDLPKEEG